MWQYFILAIGLVLTLEGIMPFLIPQKYRRLMFQMSQQPTKYLRWFGFCSMMVGLVIILLMKQFYGM